MAVFNNILAGASGQAGGAGYEIERSLRFNSDDSAYLNRTPSSAGDQKTYTYSTWLKRSDVDTARTIFFAAIPTSSNYVQFSFNSNKITLYFRYLAGTAYTLTTVAEFRDTSAWYNVVIAVDSTQSVDTDRVKIYVNGVNYSYTGTVFNQNTLTTVNSTVQHAISSYQPYAAGAYFNGYLADVHFIDGQALDPTSFGGFDDNGVWQPIAYAGSYGTNGFHLDFSDNSSAAALGTDTSGNGNDWTVNNISTIYSPTNYSSGVSYLGNGAIYSGSPGGPFQPGGNGWGVMLLQSGSVSPTNGGKITFSPAITGVTSLIARFTTPTGYTGGAFVNDNATMFSVNALGGADIDLTATLQGSSTPSTLTSLVIGPTNYNGYIRLNYLIVNGSVLYDAKWNYHNDSLLDSPTNGTQTDTGAGGEVSGNYATLQPLDLGSINTLKNGNLQVTSTTGANWSNGKSCGTIGVSSGKWYWEHTQNSNQYTYTGVGNIKSGKLDDYAGETANSYGWLSSTTKTYNNASGTALNAPSMPTGGGTVMIALDLDNGKIWWGLDGTWVTSGSSPNPATGTDPAYSGLDTTQTWFPLTGLYNSMDLTFNFGQRAFAYSAPSGYKALCTANLDDPTIADGSTVFDAVTYTGNSSTNVITGLGFSPDFLWIKARTVNGYDSRLIDSVRGADKLLYSSLTSAEATGTTNLTSFDSNGFTLGSPAQTNLDTYPFIAWTWDAGSSTVSNTDGSITSQVRANPSAGFSVVGYTGDATNNSWGHGLNSAPKLILFKSRNAAKNWLVLADVGVHSGFTVFEGLNTTNAGSDYSSSASASSTTVTIPNTTDWNDSGVTYIAYCFAPVEGYSAFGSYTGNGSADGPFVYTGFRPRWILYKNATDSPGYNWILLDSERDLYNPENNALFPNLSSSEDADNPGYDIDFTSNGFKIRHTFGAGNSSGATIIYAAFAENPFKTARAR